MKFEAIDQGVFLIGRTSEHNLESYKVQKANKAITLCELTTVTDKEKVLTTSVTLKVMSVERPSQVAESEQPEFSLTLSAGSDLIYTFSCTLKEGIKDGKETSALAEAVSAFPYHMKAKVASTAEAKHFQMYGSRIFFGCQECQRRGSFPDGQKLIDFSRPNPTSHSGSFSRWRFSSRCCYFLGCP